MKSKIRGSKVEAEEGEGWGGESVAGLLDGLHCVGSGIDELDVWFVLNCDLSSDLWMCLVE